MAPSVFQQWKGNGFTGHVGYWVRQMAEHQGFHELFKHIVNQKHLQKHEMQKEVAAFAAQVFLWDMFSSAPQFSDKITLLRVIPTMTFTHFVTRKAYLLAFYLANLLAFYLAFYVANLLAYILTYLLAFYLAFYLTYLLAYILTYPT